MRVQKIMIERSSNVSLVFLENVKNEEQVLPILIGNFGAQAIIQIVQRVKCHRPLTHDLIKNIIHKLKGEMKDVVIDNIGDEDILATIHIISGEREIAIESRACDAIALALKSNAPIYTTKILLSKVSDAMDKMKITSIDQEFMDWLDRIDSYDLKKGK